MLHHLLQTSCTGVLAVLLLRLSGLGCPFTIHSSHISLAVLLLRLSGLGCPFKIHSSHISLAVLHVAPQVTPHLRVFGVDPA
jgi:hypothetical protein